MTGPAETMGPVQEKKTPNLWAGPLLTLLVLLAPTLILIFSNTESQELEFLGWAWSAPLWLILLATFLAGIVLSRLFGWMWRAFRKRRARLRADMQATDRMAS
ncbi:MAG: LapA family protein [Acidimicrobiia bacterium]|nr:LapA family protein [Acidimicrobiia bacterium]